MFNEIFLLFNGPAKRNLNWKNINRSYLKSQDANVSEEHTASIFGTEVINFFPDQFYQQWEVAIAVYYKTLFLGIRRTVNIPCKWEILWNVDLFVMLSGIDIAIALIFENFRNN
jgi:hypothetical protein